jgi:hypothetical protein
MRDILLACNEREPDIRPSFHAGGLAEAVQRTTTFLHSKHTSQYKVNRSGFVVRAIAMETKAIQYSSVSSRLIFP